MRRHRSCIVLALSALAGLCVGAVPAIGQPSSPLLSYVLISAPAPSPRYTITYLHPLALSGE